MPRATSTATSHPEGVGCGLVVPAEQEEGVTVSLWGGAAPWEVLLWELWFDL